MTDPPPCLMRYRFSTVPTPLQASPSSALAPGMINVWAAPESGQVVYCSSIVIAVPIGDDVHDFARAAPSVTPNTQLWAVSSSRISDGEDLGLPLGTYAIFTATTTAEHYLIDYQLVFSMITDSMSRHADTFSYIVVEQSSTDPSGPMVQRRNTYTLAKAAPTLYLDDFVAVSPSAAKTTQPRTAFDNSESIKLEWASNASSFALYAGATSEPVWTGADTSYTMTSGLETDTTITLLATLDGLSVSATIALTVANPTVTSGSVAAGSVTAQSLEANGGASLAGTAVGGVLTVAGRAALGAMTTSSAAVSGATALADATIAGATISGPLTARTSTRLGAVTTPSVTISSSCGIFVVRQVSAGVTYATSTDGLVVGSVREGPRGSSCAARIWATCSATGSGHAMGGVACVYQSKTESITWGNQNFFALPVPAGSTFSVGVAQRTGTQAPVSFAWVPFGTAATLSETAHSGAGSNAGSAADQPPSRDPAAAPEALPSPRPNVRAHVDRVLGAGAALFGDRLTPELEQRLRTALIDIASHGHRPLTTSATPRPAITRPATPRPAITRPATTRPASTAGATTHEKEES